MDLVGGLGAGFDSGAAGDCQHPYPLDRPIPRTWEQRLVHHRKQPGLLPRRRCGHPCPAGGVAGGWDGSPPPHRRGPRPDAGPVRHRSCQSLPPRPPISDPTMPSRLRVARSRRYPPRTGRIPTGDLRYRPPPQHGHPGVCPPRRPQPHPRLCLGLPCPRLSLAAYNSNLLSRAQRRTEHSRCKSRSSY